MRIWALLVALGLVVHSSTGLAKETVRTWTDAQGAILVNAELVFAGENDVALKDTQGQLVIIPRARLSARDQNYLQKMDKPLIQQEAPQPPARPEPKYKSHLAESKASEPLAGRVVRKIAAEKFGATPESEKAVAAALRWLALHQMPDGSWSLVDFSKRCGRDPCSGPGSEKQDVGATAMALLPFLASGQTHVSKGPYQKHLGTGIYWLRNRQKPDGDLRGSGSMYSHGLAAMALCEAYGMSGDRTVGTAAQKAINFIQTAQNSTTGGWRYTPGEEGDTSVVGWQLMALQDAKMANLAVNPAVFDKTNVWLKSCAEGDNESLFAYTPGCGGTPTMTAVGLLCQQYLGERLDSPRMTAGATYLAKNLPEISSRNIYYSYYATQVMHNVSGPKWDQWNRAMRQILIDTQDKEGCAAGSWNPDKPKPDAWGKQGGRIMMTALSALTLEVYYRYAVIGGK